ncbi:hypothetical protein JCM9140_1923 [Halalkalibacter wakoensis JCM 9140]|uniref:EAL domain-containing protein n=1 Tax=Halalkalibacter wakoensis JCM 9140 TaxID=1236970 RepID=W4Q1S4_9BACI|nr:EAL domain-containing protein [Halalkalibacter wakoensis]GAE25902.1 hypothetical protein JCM9140_1923 [Halalkalibacter wakoensis JCM 9140]
MNNTIPTTLSAEQILSYFQPIVGAEKQTIIGYEILGRYQFDGNIHSLGSYFYRDDVKLSYKKVADRCVRTKALQLIESYPDSTKSFFFNINPEFFSDDEDLIFYEQLCNVTRMNPNVKAANFILEITEANFSKNDSLFLDKLNKYRELGCKIAVDDFGKGFSNLERVASLQPHILKIDLDIVQKSKNSQSHRDVLHSLSILSRRIGAELLFEGIESVQLLENAWKHGAQYYQGYFFSKPMPKPKTELDCLHTFHDRLEKLIEQSILQLHEKYSLEESLNTQLKVSFTSTNNIHDFDDLLKEIYKELPSSCFRLYICNRLGYQLSGNHIKYHQDRWFIENEHRHKNWSWRPYFLQNIVNMERNQKGVLSDLYTDIETRKLIYTFAFPIRMNTYLFIDITVPDRG